MRRASYYCDGQPNVKKKLWKDDKNIKLCAIYVHMIQGSDCKEANESEPYSTDRSPYKSVFGMLWYFS